MEREIGLMELCSIASGSSGNCICVGADDCHVLIDAGVSGKRIEEGLNGIGLTTSDMKGILVTHEHIDHVAGLGVVARKYGLPMYATRGTIDAVLHMPSVGAVDGGLFTEIAPGTAFSVGELMVEAISVSHDAAEPVAYKIRHGAKTVAVMTDLGAFDERTVAWLQNLDALLIEANHDVRMLETGSYPYPLKQRILGERGHLSNEASGRLLGRVLHDHLKHVVLGHLSKENNYPELAYETVRLEVELGENPYRAGDFPITVARRDAAMPKIEF